MKINKIKNELYQFSKKRENKKLKESPRKNIFSNNKFQK